MASKTPRPGRTLAAFFLVTVALFGAVAAGRDWTPELGLDLQGGTRIVFQATTETGEDITSAKLEEARDIINQRVNGTGVSGAVVTTRGSDQILIEVPGQEQSELADQVASTAQLRFRLVWGVAGQQVPTPTAAPTPPTSGPTKEKSPKPKDDESPAKQRAVPFAASGQGNNNNGGDGEGGNNGGGGEPTTSPTETPTPPAPEVDWSALSLDEMIQMEKTNQGPTPEYDAALQELNAQADSFDCSPESLGAVVDAPEQPLVTCEPQTGQVYVLSPAVIEGTQLDDASAGIPQQSVEWIVQLDLNGEATDVFTNVTEQLSPQGSGTVEGLPFAIVLDGEVISAPYIKDRIADGNPTISGGTPAFTQETATNLANSLKYGALPLSFEQLNSQVVGPSLAGSQLDAGLLAGLFGLGLVVAYALLYYRGLGLVIVVSLMVAAAETYAFVVLLGNGIGLSLSLPGIAGLIVAIGITADSFIVFFERIRDEVRDGKSLRLAVEAGWKRARLTILAADSVSLLSALILYIFTVDEVRGFAFFLGLTTAVDILLVFFFTKPLVTRLARTQFFGQGHRLSGLDAKHLGIEGRSVSQMARTARGEA